MFVPITSRTIYDWHNDQKLYVYSADRKCVELCTVADLDLCPITSDMTRFVEPVDENLQLCEPRKRELPPNCVGGIHCPYPGVCYRFETEQQDYECTFPTEEDDRLLAESYQGTEDGICRT